MSRRQFPLLTALAALFLAAASVQAQTNHPAIKPDPVVERTLVSTTRRGGTIYEVYLVSTYDHSWTGSSWRRNTFPSTTRQELRPLGVPGPGPIPGGPAPMHPAIKPDPVVERTLVSTYRQGRMIYDVYRISTYDYTWTGNSWRRSTFPTVRQEIVPRGGFSTPYPTPYPFYPFPFVP